MLKGQANKSRQHPVTDAKRNAAPLANLPLRGTQCYCPQSSSDSGATSISSGSRPVTSNSPPQSSQSSNSPTITSSATDISAPQTGHSFISISKIRLAPVAEQSTQYSEFQLFPLAIFKNRSDCSKKLGRPIAHCINKGSLRDFPKCTIAIAARCTSPYARANRFAFAFWIQERRTQNSPGSFQIDMRAKSC